MSGPSSHTGAAVAALVPVVSLLSALVLVLTGGGATSDEPTSNPCGGAGTEQTVAGVALDADQLGQAQTIVSVVALRQLTVRAAVIAVTTAYTESALRNSSVQTDHDSEGLFQQRVSIYTEVVAVDPVRATGAFLDRLVNVVGWETMPVGVVAQTVQVSAFPARYEPNRAMAEAVVGQLWPTAVAQASTGPGAPAICAGAGGAIPAGEFVGPSGNNVAGTTTIPDGFVINGSDLGTTAVQYALAQLGKPYVWAAAGPDAFDCSGLTMAAWAVAGVGLPHHAASQTSSGVAGPTNLTQAVAGDLVMIPGSDGTAANPGHVGMVAGYADAADGRHLYLVQAPMTGVPVELTDATRWSGQIVAVRHIA